MKFKLSRRRIRDAIRKKRAYWDMLDQFILLAYPEHVRGGRRGGAHKIAMQELVERNISMSGVRK